jgi:hypothetical protein
MHWPSIEHLKQLKEMIMNNLHEDIKHTAKSTIIKESEGF